MTAGVKITMQGALDAHRMLKDMEFACRRRIVSAAVRAANNEIIKVARQLAPVDTGLMKRQITGTVKMGRVNGIVYGYIRAKASKKQRKKGVMTSARYVHLVVGGTKPHSIQKGDEGPMLALPGFYATKINHPGGRAQPFIQQAADRAWKDAVRAFDFKFDQAFLKELAKARATG